MKIAMQLYALKRDFLMRWFSLASLNRDLKYMAVALFNKKSSVCIWVSAMLCFCDISVLGQQNFLIYQFYSTRLIQRKSKFTLIDIVWGLHSNRSGEKLFGAEQIFLSWFIFCCDRGIQSVWHFFTAVFSMQVYFHNICHTSIQSWHILLQIQPL